MLDGDGEGEQGVTGTVTHSYATAAAAGPRVSVCVGTDSWPLASLPFFWISLAIRKPEARMHRAHRRWSGIARPAGLNLRAS